MRLFSLSVLCFICYLRVDVVLFLPLTSGADGILHRRGLSLVPGVRGRWSFGFSIGLLVYYWLYLVIAEIFLCGLLRLQQGRYLPKGGLRILFSLSVLPIVPCNCRNVLARFAEVAAEPLFVKKGGLQILFSLSVFFQ